MTAAAVTADEAAISLLEDEQQHREVTHFVAHMLPDLCGEIATELDSCLAELGSNAPLILDLPAAGSITGQAAVQGTSLREAVVEFKDKKPGFKSRSDWTL